MADLDPDQPLIPRHREEAKILLLKARIDALRAKARQEAETKKKQPTARSTMEDEPPYLTGPYSPIPNPGWNETRMLTEWPDWVEEAPWRLMGARNQDYRCAKFYASMAAEGQLADPTKMREPFGDLNCYTPIENPGPSEARALKDHPDWVERFPWRLVWRRECDQRCQREAEAKFQMEHQALLDLMALESEKVFREAIDI